MQRTSWECTRKSSHRASECPAFLGTLWRRSGGRHPPRLFAHCSPWPGATCCEAGPVGEVAGASQPGEGKLALAPSVCKRRRKQVGLGIPVVQLGDSLFEPKWSGLHLQEGCPCTKTPPQSGLCQLLPMASLSWWPWVFCQGGAGREAAKGKGLALEPFPKKQPQLVHGEKTTTKASL